MFIFIDLFWILIIGIEPFALYEELGNGLILTIKGFGSVNFSAVHELSFSKFITISIQDGITRLEDDCFSDCESLVSIALPNKLEFLGSGSFRNCYKLKETVLPEGIKHIPNNVFTNCHALEKISIPSSVTEIQPMFMNACGQMSKFDVSPNNLCFSTDSKQEILTSKNRTVAICSKGSGELVIPSEIQSFGSYFCFLKSITKITFEANSHLKSISSYFLYDAYKLFSFEAPSSLQRIDDYAFDRSYVVNITIQKTLQYLSPKAFSGVINLQNVFIPQECNAIKKLNDVIYNPDQTVIIFVLPTVVILNISTKLETLAHSLIRTTVSLESVKVVGENRHYSSYSGALYSADYTTFYACPYQKRKISIHRNCGTVDTAAFKGTLIEEVIIEGQIKKILDEALIGCSKLKSFPLSSTIECIGGWCFMGCSSFKASIELGPKLTTCGVSSFHTSGIISADLSLTGLTSIPEKMFYQCHNLISIKLPKECQYIGLESFYQTPVKEITIGSRITSIEDRAFYQCRNISKITFNGNSLKTIGIRSFTGSNIKQIKFQPSLEYIKGMSFQGCSKLEYIEFEIKNSKLVSIDADAFDGCSNLKEVTLPPCIKSLNPTSFSICSNLMNIFIGNDGQIGSVYKSDDGTVFSADAKTLIICPSGREDFLVKKHICWIGHKAFINCQYLDNIKFESGSLIESLNTSVFEGCISMRLVNFGDVSKLRTIGDRVFYKCTSLQLFSFPNSVRQIGVSAFEGCVKLQTKLPKSLEIIGSNAFRKCSSLTRIDLGIAISELGPESFFECSSIRIITYCGNKNLNVNNSFEQNPLKKSIQCFVLPSYPSQNLGGLPVLKSLDIDCNIPTTFFTLEENMALVNSLNPLMILNCIFSYFLYTMKQVSACSF